MINLILIISAFVLSIIFFLLFIPISYTINLLDKPDSKLKKHKHAIPLIGGPVLLIIIIILYIIQYFIKINFYFNNVFLISILTIGILGIIDDYRRLSPLPKIIVQTIVVIYMIANGYVIAIELFPYYINYAITFLWIMGIMNAFNLMDIMDAFAGGIAIIISFTLFFINLSIDSYNVLLLSVLIGYLFAFLLFNKPKAKIFLGDSGALLLGLILSILSINTKYTSINNIAFITPILIFAIPIFDTTFVVLERILHGRNPLHGSQDHFVLKLKTIVVENGFIVFIMMVFQTCLSLFAYISTIINLYWAIALYMFVFVILVRIGFYIHLKAQSCKK